MRRTRGVQEQPADTAGEVLTSAKRSLITDLCLKLFETDGVFLGEGFN